MSYCDPDADLTPNDIAGIQRSYGRRLTGSLVSPQGNCAASHYAVGSGDPVFLWDCDEAYDDQEWWDSVSSGDQRYLFLWGWSKGSYCMAPVWPYNGAPVKLEKCHSDDDWVFERVYIRGFGGLCLDLHNGDTTNGNKIQMWRCGALGGANQRWSISGDGHLRYGSLSSNKCARVYGGKLVIWDCQASWSSQKFSFNGQRIKWGSQCLDVHGPSDGQYLAGIGMPVNGMRIQTFSCNSSLNQKWNLTGNIRYANNKSLCLARKNGADSNGAPLVVRYCQTGADAQTWDYYF
jgi:hypothetical protein